MASNVKPGKTPAKESPTNDASVVTIPSNCIPVGRSPRISTAPASVHNGDVARMGEASDNGRCFSPK